MATFVVTTPVLEKRALGVPSTLFYIYIGPHFGRGKARPVQALFHFAAPDAKASANQPAKRWSKPLIRMILVERLPVDRKH